MNFEVEDWDRWHTAFLANSKMREENDIKEIYVGHELQNKNKVHVIYDTPAPDTIQKMMQNPEVQKVMKNAGNKVETMVVAMRARIAIGISCGALIIKGGTVAVIAEKSANINDPNKRIPIPWGK